MPSDSNLPNLPPSPIRDDDKFIVNRDNVSHKINASDFLLYLNDIEFPIVKPCDVDADCPPGYICYNGQCVLRCDGGCNPTDPTDNYSCCPDGQICVEVDSNNSVCLPYPFPCDSLPIPNPCPDGFVCVGGLCMQQCGLNGACPPGHICAIIDGLAVCVPYPFPCPEDGICPQDFECYNGFCLATCGRDGECPDGSACIEVELDDGNGGTISHYYCVPYPFPCGSIPPHVECPPGFYCYGGMCYPVCDNGTGNSDYDPRPEIIDPTCPPGYICTPIGNENNNEGQDGGGPISICLPDPYPEGIINDGKLNIIDDQNNRRIIFTANQYGDTFLKFNGIDIDGGNGGGSGSGDLSFRTLWKRVNEDDLDSDIQPTYPLDPNTAGHRYINVVPNGVDESNFGLPDNQWKALYTSGLRNVNTHGDHIGTGTTAQRPTDKPEGGAIEAGEVRFNTDRQAQEERYTQDQHDKDLEVYNGSEWVRMNPKAIAPQYDDNFEKRLIYGRGLTIKGTDKSKCPDSEMASFPLVYPTPAIEPKLGRGLGWSPDGAIELHNLDDDDDVLIWYTPLFKGKPTAESRDLGLNNTWDKVNDFVTGTEWFPIPAGANRAIITFAYKLKMYPRSVYEDTTYNLQNLDINFGSGGGGINNPGNVTIQDQLSTCAVVADPVAYWEGDVGAENIHGVRQDRIGTNASISMTTHRNIPPNDNDIFQASWTTKVEDVKFTTIGPGGGTLGMRIELEMLGGMNCTCEYDVYRIMVQPYNSTIPAIRSAQIAEAEYGN